MATKGKQSKKPRDASKRLEAIGEAELIAKLFEGMSNRQIALEVGVSTTTMTDWFNATSDRSARAKAARQASADAEDDKALDALLAIPDAASSGQIARAREEAQHRRWRAKVRNPERYGDKLAVDQNVNMDIPAMLGELKSIFGKSDESS